MDDVYLQKAAVNRTTLAKLPKTGYFLINLPGHVERRLGHSHDGEISEKRLFKTCTYALTDIKCCRRIAGKDKALLLAIKILPAS